MISQRSLVTALLCLALLSGGSLNVPSLFAADPEVVSGTLAERARQLDEEVAALERERGELAQWSATLSQQREGLSAQHSNALLLQEAQLEVEAARVRLESAQLDRLAAMRHLGDLDGRAAQLAERISSLRKQQEKAAATEGGKPLLDAAIAESALIQQRLVLERRHVDNLQSRQGLAEQRLGLAKGWLASVSAVEQQYQSSSRREAMQDLEDRLNRERDTLLAKANELRESRIPVVADDANNEAERSLLDSHIKQAEESAFLLQVSLEEARAREQLARIIESLGADGDEALLEASRELAELSGELTPLKSLLSNKLTVIRQQQSLNERRLELNPAQQRLYRQAVSNFQQLVANFQAQMDSLSPLLNEVVQRQSGVRQLNNERLRQGLRHRHVLPKTLHAWQPLLGEMLSLPGMLWRVSGETIGYVNKALLEADDDSLTLYLFLLLVWGGLWLWSQRFVNRMQARWQDPHKGQSFVLHIGLFFSDYWYRRRVGLWPVVGMLLAVGVLDVPQRSSEVVLWLAGLWVATTFIYTLARWLLIGRMISETNRRADLYRAFRLTLIFSALFAAIVALAHLGFVSRPLQEVIDRLFLPFLIMPAILSLRIRSHVMALLRERVQRGLWYETIRLSTLAVPLLLFVAAFFGLIGFINLAWYVTVHLAGFLLVFAVWLVVASLLNDLADMTKNYVNLHTESGLVWAKGVIEPLAYLTFVGTLVAAVVFLFHLFGWGTDAAIVLVLRQVLEHPLFTLGESAFDLKHIIGTLILLVAVLFGARWIRQFTYRWLYAGVIDLGIRNSLSVFTQYAFVLIGLVIALNVLGVDLTSLAIFAGALGVGIGFGLQNIANNFISGLILLVERPIRSSDWVTIGSNEGEVKRIGIRSVTVTTWDNQDVVIPNAEIVTTPFINWTLSDNIVRTVIFMGISYHDDPHRAIRVIEDAVHAHPAVLSDPPCRVWLREFGNSSVDFRIHYHIDVRQHSRLEVKSEVMLHIWDALKAEGLTIPFPQQDLYIKEIPGHT